MINGIKSFLFLAAAFGCNASLHPEMGPPHILDPEGVLMDERGLPQYASWSKYKAFSPSEDYKELQAIFNEITIELKKNPNLKRRQFLDKMLATTQQGLIQLYLRDKNIHTRENKRAGEYLPGSKKESTQPFNRVIDKSGAILWAHRQGILGQGVDVWVLEDWGTLEKEGLPTPRLASVIKSTQLPLPQALRKNAYDVREEGLAHGAEVTGVVYQIAPKADIHLIGDSIFSALFHPTHPQRGQVDNPFPKKDIILNWSGSKGSARVSVDYQIGHIRGFFEARSRYGDLLVSAIPNYEGGYKPSREKRRDRKWMKEQEDLITETDPAFAEHILQPYRSHIILAGNIGKSGPDLSPFLRDDQLQNLAQERFLLAWGDEVLVPFIGPNTIEVKSGTSIAAPTISGAAALIKSKYPHLTCAEAGEILLESAERTFWGGFRNQTFVYEPEDFEEESPEELGAAFAQLFGEAFVPKSEKIRLPSKIKAEPFSSALYGRGILNLRRAFIYAETKDKHPGLTAEQLKPLFKAAVRAQEEGSARTIQRAFRANIGKFKSRAGTAGKA